MSWLSDDWNAVKAWLANIAPKVLAFLKPVAQQVTEDEIAIAEGAVAVGFTTPGDGIAKMTAALAYFESESAAKELPFIESQARVLIEIALQNAKTAATPVASVSTASATTPAV